MLMTKGEINKTLSATKLLPTIAYSDAAYAKRRKQNLSVPNDYPVGNNK